jgi:hypothetical protein
VKLKAKTSLSERQTSQELKYSVAAEGLWKVSVASIDENRRRSPQFIFQCHDGGIPFYTAGGGGGIVSLTNVFVDRIWTVLFWKNDDDIMLWPTTCSYITPYKHLRLSLVLVNPSK